MRLLHYDQDGRLVLTRFDDYEQPTYTILSHTWGNDEEEVSFADLKNGGGKDKLGYNKIRFCGEQTRWDGYQYFWVDTCCIDKSNKAELSSAIRSMFRWYQDAAKCYVYLSDVSTKDRNPDGILTETVWEHSLTSSRWFTRGWTLQELLAPSVVELFSQEWERIGDKTSLGPLISSITGIRQEVLQESSLAQFDISERLRWRGVRKTKLEEDMAYSLSGICDVDIAPLYGEGGEEAFKRLRKEIEELKDCLRDLRHGDPKDDKKRIEETKGGLLVDSYRWVLDNDIFQQWQREPQTQLLWVKGDPGKGKTMLLCGIIDDLCSSMPKTALLSYFFCQATFSHLNSATAVLRGLLYMLITQQPSLASHIYKRYDIARKRLFEDANAWVALTEIWLEVLRDPGLRTGYLLIDALDECTTDRSKLLRFIAKQSSSSSRLKWIVSSRNWPEIERCLGSAAGNLLLSLELNAQSISAAVKAFITIKVSQLAEEERYDEQTQNVMSEYLGANANDTFLWVALVCQHLKGIAKRHVVRKLRSIPLGLEPFYKRMMSGISESEDAETCRCVLATTAILFRPVVIEELIAIVEPLKEFADDLETVREIVKLCGSFLTITRDTVYLVHQSAQDFLLADAKHEIFPNGIDMVHQEIFRGSLGVLSSRLHKDMYKLTAPGASIDIIQPPNPDPLTTLRYSCVYWIDHICNAKAMFQDSNAGKKQVADTIMLFVKEKYLYWLEALSLCKNATKCVAAMKALSSLAEETLDAQDLVELVKDAHRFSVNSKDVIESHPLQTYASALLFSPSASLIRTAFQHESPNWITIEPDVSETWGSCLHTFEESCRAVAFSHDSNHIALGFENGTIKIWDADSSTYLPKFEDHKTDLRAIDKVRFFHDSARLATISISDKMIQAWDIATGTYLSSWQYDRGTCNRRLPFCKNGALEAFASATIGDSVRIFDTAEARELSLLASPYHDPGRRFSSTFSPSGRFLAVSFVTNIKIWDATSNRHIQSLELPVPDSDSKPATVLSVGVSDSDLVVVGLKGNTVIVFSVNNGEILHILKSDTGSGFNISWMVAISPDARKVAASLCGTSLKIWDLSNILNPQTLFPVNDRIVSAAFSPDSKRLVSTSDFRGETKIWDVRGQGCSRTLGDHQGDMNSVTFSLTLSNDSKYLASGASRLALGAFDSSVKIWDLHGRCLQTLRGHSDDIFRIDVFNDPARVGSFSFDKTYRIWDVVSGRCLQAYQWLHPNGGARFAVSPDLRMVARAPSEIHKRGSWQIQLWDRIDRVRLRDLRVDMDTPIRSFVFSGDSTLLAVLMNDNIIKIFHTGSGDCLQTLGRGCESSGMRLHKHGVGYRCVTFSDDATRLASASVDGTTRVWDRNSGRCLHTIENNPITDVSFDQSGQFLLTNIGRIAIPASSNLKRDVAAPITHSPLVSGVGLSPDSKWITYNSVNVLWLPREYRPERSVVSGNSVGVTVGSKLLIFTLSPEYLE